MKTNKAKHGEIDKCINCTPKKEELDVGER